MASTGAFKRLDDLLKTPVGVVTLCVGLFGMAMWAFLPALQGTFLVHDDFAIISNPHINSGLTWANVGWAFSSFDLSQWMPLTGLSHMLDVEIYGLDPWGHHLTNVLLHALNTVLVFVVFREMTGATWRSWLVAALFGLHPLRVAAVAWITERREVLSLLFWLLAMWTYARYARAEIQNSKFKIRDPVFAIRNS